MVLLFCQPGSHLVVRMSNAWLTRWVIAHSVSPPGCSDTVVAAHALYRNKEKEGNSRILAIRNNLICCISQFFRSSFLKVSLKVLDSCVWVSMSHSHRFLIQSERLMSPHITRPFVYNFQSRLHSKVLFLAGESTLYLKSVAEEHTLRYFAGLIPKRNHALLIVLAQERPPSPQRNEKKQINKASRILIGCIIFLAECCPLAIFFSY